MKSANIKENPDFSGKSNIYFNVGPKYELILGFYVRNVTVHGIIF